MAEGDFRFFTLIEIINADTYRVVFQDGPLAGTVQVARLSEHDAYERVGPEKYLGQSGVEVARAEFDRVDGDPTLRELGVDQYGRICGTVGGSPISGGDIDVGLRLFEAGLAEKFTRTDVGTVAHLSSSPRLAGFGFDGDLVVDTTQP